MNIEIEVTSFIVLGRTYYIMVHIHAYIQYNFFYDPYCPKSYGRWYSPVGAMTLSSKNPVNSS
jgi:hypothetical protein